MNDSDVQRLLSAVDQCCEHVAGSIPRLAELGRGLQESLRAPPKVAIVGRISSGKSTLVNALLGREVAPTAHTECTRIVTEFRYDKPERVEFVLSDGRSETVPLESGRVPAKPPDGIDWRDVSLVHAFLASEFLTKLTVIDTPGLGSSLIGHSSDDRSGDTEVKTISQRSREAAAHADATIFLLDQLERTEDLGAMAERDTARGSTGGRLGSIALVGKADQLTDPSNLERDPVQVAREQAKRLQHGRLSRHVEKVLAVAPLLAANAQMGRLDHRIVKLLDYLAQLPDEEAFQHVHGAGMGGVSTTLRSVLGTPDGVLRARDVVRDRSRALENWAIERSGIPELRGDVLAHLSRRGPLLQVTRVLSELNATAAGHLPHAVRVGLRDLLEDVVLLPEYHLIDAMAALSRLAAVQDHPPELMEQLEAICDGTLMSGDIGKADLRKRLRDARELEASPSNPAVRRAAAALARSLQSELTHSDFEQ